VPGVLLHAPRGPFFYSPKAARSRLNSIWKALVAFCPWAHWTVRCTTGQWAVHDFLPFLAKPYVAAMTPWYTGQSDVIFRLLVKSTCRPLIVWPTVGVGAAATPDSTVNYSRDSSNFSREQSVRRARQPEHRTLSGAIVNWCKFGWA
jgi:hypothetical protein